MQHTQNPIHSPATVPSNAPRLHQQPQYIPQPASIPQHVHGQIPAPMSMGATRIKTEAGSNGHPPMPQMPQMPQMPLHDMNQSARDRAAAALKEKYGDAAASTVRQMQGQPQLPPNSLGQIPQIKQEHGYPPIGGQTDGGDDSLADWKAEVARRRAAAQSGEGDRLLREHLKKRSLDREGGGLMRPLDEHESPARIARRAAISASLEQGTETAPGVPRMAGQVDGADGDDSKEEDEDAINSDLDDPDDLLANDHDDDESEGQIMLCTYEKVQRVKNKWKCTLKDGILTSGGKE